MQDGHSGLKPRFNGSAAPRTGASVGGSHGAQFLLEVLDLIA